MKRLLLLLILITVSISPAVSWGKQFVYTGRILTTDGKPVSGANITFYKYEAAGDMQMHCAKCASIKSGANGFYKYVYESGKLPNGLQGIITVYAKSSVKSQHPDLVAIRYISTGGYSFDKPLIPTDMVVAPMTQVRLQCLYLGKPVSHVRIFPEIISNPDPKLPRIESDLESANLGDWMARETDANGYAVFDGLPQGDVILLKTIDPRFSDRLTPASIQLARTSISTDHSITLKPGVILIATVLDKKTNKPVKNCVVSISVNSPSTMMQYSGFTTNTKGQCRIAHLAPMTYQLTFTKRGEKPLGKLVTLTVSYDKGVPHKTVYKVNVKL